MREESVPLDTKDAHLNKTEDLDVYLIIDNNCRGYRSTCLSNTTDWSVHLHDLLEGHLTILLKLHNL